MPEFAVCFEGHQADGRVWAVKYPLGDIDDNQGWSLWAVLDCCVPLASIYRGRQTPEPRAYFVGAGTLKACGDGICSLR